VLPELEIGPVTLASYGVMLWTAMVAAGALVTRRFEELGRSRDHAWELCLAGAAGGLVGGRVYAIVADWSAVADSPFGALLSPAGFSWHGGLLGGALAAGAWALWRGELRLGLFDIAAPALALGYAVIRIGCQLAGDGDYGEPWEGPWAMAYPDGVVPTSVEVHPVPVYEVLAMGLVALALWRHRDRFRPGVLFGLYLLAAGTERFLVDFLRVEDPVLAGLGMAQVQSLALVGVGLGLLAAVSRSPDPLRLPASG
jgi:phosphatidylglycerol---prolipoprotein diacylglyceryl transferase